MIDRKKLRVVVKNDRKWMRETVKMRRESEKKLKWWREYLEMG